MKGKSNSIGLDAAKAKVLAENLNDLLANFQLFYQNLRGFHWNIRGEKFFELHAKFEEYYTDAQEKIDEIAERVLMLEAKPLHSFTDYLKAAKIKERKNMSEGKVCIQAVVDDLSTILQKERKVAALAAEADDEGTVALMSDYISAQEKTLWMLNSYLG